MAEAEAGSEQDDVSFLRTVSTYLLYTTFYCTDLFTLKLFARERNFVKVVLHESLDLISNFSRATSPNFDSNIVIKKLAKGC